jgi:hypothetical protein
MVRIDICSRFCSLLLHAATMVMTISLLSTPTTLYGADYPVIFKSNDEVRKLGMDLFGWGPKPFQNKCYIVGESRRISISNEFFARFKSRGFTLESVCLGLDSETRYDPETGRRLPTYIFVDMEAVARGDGSIEENMTGEMPLDLPNCFRNGTPYSDCVFRFGRKTGKALTPAETATYAELGAAIDKSARAAIATGDFAADAFEDCDGQRPCKSSGFRKTSGAGGFEVPERLSRYSSVTWWVRSSNLPRGYGYVLDVEGAADPGVSADSVKAAMDNLSKSQINVEELRRRLNAR